MSLKHFEIHKLERKIADVIRRGHPKMDAADCLQAGHDITDMLITDYAMEDRDALLEEMGIHDTALGEAVKNLRRLLSEPNSGLGTVLTPAVQAAGVGGGMGEAR